MSKPTRNENNTNENDNRNTDLDRGLGGCMFSGIVTGAQDRYREQMSNGQR